MAGQSNGDCRRKQQPNIEAGLPYPFGDGYRDPPHQAALHPNKLRAKSRGRRQLATRGTSTTPRSCMWHLLMCT